MDGAIATILIEVLLGGALGFCIGLTGVGGGLLGVPALTLGLGLSPSVAVGTASTYAALTRIYAVIEHWRLGTIHLSTAALFLGGALPGTVLAAMFVKQNAGLEGFQDKLGWFIFWVVLLAGAAMVANMVRSRGRAERPTAQASSWRDKPRWQIGVGLLLGFVTGAVIASTSVGGGVIVIPILVFFFGLPIARTVGTSLLISFVLLAVAGLVYLFIGAGREVEIGAALWMSLGSLVGVRFGSRLSARAPAFALQAAVVAMILLSAGAMGYRLA